MASEFTGVKNSFLWKVLKYVLSFAHVLLSTHLSFINTYGDEYTITVSSTRSAESFFMQSLEARRTIIKISRDSDLL